MSNQLIKTIVSFIVICFIGFLWIILWNADFDCRHKFWEIFWEVLDKVSIIITTIVIIFVVIVMWRN